MAAWWEKFDKIDKFDKRMREPSAQKFFDAAYIIFLLIVIIQITGSQAWIWTGSVVILLYATEAFRSARIFLQGPPENKEAKAYDQGYRAGRSRAMRHMSDEPELSLEMGANPYEKS